MSLGDGVSYVLCLGLRLSALQWGSNMSNCTQALKKRIAQLEAELQAMRWQSEAQLQRIAYKFRREFLALIDGDVNTRVTLPDIM